MERPASEGEIAQMREIVRRGIRAGAVGFATSKSPTHVGYSGKPVPSRKAEIERDNRARERARARKKAA